MPPSWGHAEGLWQSFPRAGGVAASGVVCCCEFHAGGAHLIDSCRDLCLFTRPRGQLCLQPAPLPLRDPCKGQDRGHISTAHLILGLSLQLPISTGLDSCLPS